MNVLFLMSDSLTPHLTGPYGDGAGSTPNLDELARRGVVFENAYCNSPLCVPSRASMVTGRYSSDLNCYDNASDFASEWPTIGHSLGSIGYETYIIGKMHFVGHDQYHGFDGRLALETDYTKAYDPLGYLLAYDWERPSGGNPAGPEWMGPSYVNSGDWDHYPRHYDWDEKIHREAISYLSEKEPGCDPFFACVSYHQPHNPFWIPREIREIFQDRDLPLPEIPPGVETCHGPMDVWLNDFHYQPEVREAMMEEENLRWLYETYYGMTYDMDRRVGEVLDLLGKRGLADDTAIVFASDHGDMLAHRGMLQKRYFYERSVRSCLIFSYPGRWQQDVRISAPVSLIDLFPTFADLAGAPLPGDLPGMSLLETVETGSEPPPNRPILCEYHGEGVHAPCFMSVMDGFKYVYVHGHEERLYDLVEDPDEYVNLVGEKQHESK
ncbi:MAG: sulfatase-like hydrolase/transferase, partial [Theionarchaea archaeon]|nr:sulfatase-like hydrolase/transferase [Theionarchaea archaeon]